MSSSAPEITPVRTSSSTASQVKALFAKSMTYQKRQSKSNCCQILTPIILAILMFLLQQLVDSFVQSANGEGKTIKGIVHPGTFPAFFAQTDTAFESCVSAFGRSGSPAPEQNGSLANGCPTFTSKYNPLNLLVIRDGTVNSPLGSTACSSNETGLFNGAESASPYVTLRARVYPDRGNSLTLCDRQPFFAYPLNATVTSQTLSEVQSFIYERFQKMSIFGGFVIRAYDLAAKSLSASVFLNRTLTGNVDAQRYSSILTQAAVRAFSGGVNSTSYTGYRNFPTRDKPNSFDLISLIGPFFYIFVLQLQLPVLLSGIVHEKEHKLREIMKIMGLRMVPYYIVNYLFAFVFYFIVAMAFWIMCALLRFRYWSLNSPAAIFVLLFIWGHVMVAMVFLFSTIFAKTSSATVGGYLFVFGNSLLASIIVNSFLNQKATPRWVIILCELFPPFAFYRGLVILSNGVVFGEIGLEWRDINNPNVQLGEVYGFLIAEWFVVFAAAIYIELVFSSGFGVRKHPAFLCHRATYCSDVKDDEELDITAAVELDGDSPDVAAERRRAVTSTEFMDMRITDLRKVYPARAGSPPKLAVQQLSLGLSVGTCLGFLGPNGAGKSTMISMIAGLFAPTSGSVHVVGYDSATHPDVVHLNMGVCAQDDLLWLDLTGEEHLRFYGRLKNLKSAELKAAIDQILDDVSLGDPATRKKLVREYSGGMKRRLSVACALIGYPRLVLLDECSTGLDPASRQQLWKVIRTYKKRCAMLLTTHSMEEAEELCDRVSIFVDGKLRVIGSTPELKFQYGQGYKITTLSSEDDIATAHAFVQSVAPTAALLNSLAGTRNYEVPKKDVKLSALFKAFTEKAERNGLRDWGISNSTLEEVFLKILIASGWEHLADLGAASNAGDAVPMHALASSESADSEQEGADEGSSSGESAVGGSAEGDSYETPESAADSASLSSGDEDLSSSV